MASHPGVAQADDESSEGVAVDCESEVGTPLVTEEPLSPGRQQSCTRDEPTSDVISETSGALDCSLVQARGSPEREGDEEDWPEGVEVECKLEEVNPGTVEDTLSHLANKEQSGFSVTVTRVHHRRNRRPKAGVAGPSGEVQVKSDSQDGPADVGVGDGSTINDMKSPLLNAIPTRHLTRPYGCELCEYRGKYRSDLEAHMRTHTGEKPFACKLCDYRGTHSSHLKYHMRTHTGEKPFVCNICDYRCIHAGRLKDHMMVHTGEKPYSCGLCEFKCSRTGILKRHLRMHTGEKPYACDICDYRCSETGTLKAHKRTHTGEKPYACDRCDYRSVQASALRKHKKTHASQNS